MVTPLLFQFVIMAQPGMATSDYTAPFREIKSVGELPDLVRMNIFRPELQVSDPGGTFNTGMPGDRNPHRARMLFAGQSKKLVIVGYETFENSYNRYLIVFQYTDTVKHQVLNMTLPKTCNTLSVALKYLHGGTYFHPNRDTP